MPADGTGWVRRSPPPPPSPGLPQPRAAHRLAAAATPTLATGKHRMRETWSLGNMLFVE